MESAELLFPTMPSHPPNLGQFIEDEVARAPLLMEEVLNGLVAMQAPATSPDARLLPELQRLVHLYRPDLVGAFSRALDDLLQPARRPDPRHQRVTLSLVENDAVATDVALSHAVDAVRHRAEFELRELRAFVAALVGDRHVSRDHNPLRPELYVKALWAALTTLPVSRPMQLAFLRVSTPALARGVRLALAAASTRLEDAGLTPSKYRTIVTATTTRAGGAGPTAPADLERLRQALPPPPAALIAADGAQAPHALLPRIFESIVQRSGLPHDVQALLARVQPVALRVAQQDPIALDAYTHPLWAFLDRVAFIAELHPTANEPRERLLAQAGALIDTLTQEDAPDAASFRWALKRLTDALQQRFDERLRKAAGHIATLETLGPSITPIAAAQGRPLALDAATLDTVRADLLEDARRDPGGETRPGGLDDPAAAAWIDAQSPGRWARLFVDGRWRPVQLLWHVDDLWLYAEVDDDGQAWALRHSALQRLHAEGLLRELRERSLVKRAAARLARDESTGTPG